MPGPHGLGLHGQLAAAALPDQVQFVLSCAGAGGVLGGALGTLLSIRYRGVHTDRLAGWGTIAGGAVGLGVLLVGDLP